MASLELGDLLGHPGLILLICNVIVFHDQLVINLLLSVSLVELLLSQLWPAKLLIVVLHDVNVSFLRRRHLEMLVDPLQKLLAEADACSHGDDEHGEEHDKSND